MERVRILVIGMSSVVGGIETLFINVFRNIDKKKLAIDFLTFWPKCAYEEELMNNGSHVYHFARRGKNPIKNYIQLKNFYKQNCVTYDYIWINLSSASNCTSNILARRYTNAKIISHSHGTNFESKNGLTHMIHKLLHYKNQAKLLKCTDYYFACSKAAGEWLFGKSLLNHYYIVNNGVNTEALKFDQSTMKDYRRKLGLDNKFVVGHIGRFIPVKNHEFVIDVFNELHKINENAYLVLVGEGETQQIAKRKVDFYHLEHCVSFLGFRKDIPKLLQAMDVFVLPSWYEGLPITAVEAQASGLPCFLSDTITGEADITDLVHHLSINLPAKAWAEKISTLNYDFDRTQYSDRVEKQGYDIQTTTEKLEEFFILN